MRQIHTGLAKCIDTNFREEIGTKLRNKSGTTGPASRGYER